MMISFFYFIVQNLFATMAMLAGLCVSIIAIANTIKKHKDGTKQSSLIKVLFAVFAVIFVTSMVYLTIQYLATVSMENRTESDGSLYNIAGSETEEELENVTEDPIEETERIEPTEEVEGGDTESTQETAPLGGSKDLPLKGNNPGNTGGTQGNGSGINTGNGGGGTNSGETESGDTPGTGGGNTTGGGVPTVPVGSGNGSNDVPKELPLAEVTDVTLSKSSLTMKVGESYQLSANVFCSDNKNQDVVLVWKSSDESVATVDTKGNIKAVGSGTTEIVVNASRNNSSKLAKCIVSVASPPTGYTISLSSYTLTLGQTFYIYVTPNEKNMTIYVHAKSPSGKVDTYILKDNGYFIDTELGVWTIYATIKNDDGTYEASKTSDFVYLEVTMPSWDINDWMLE